jgi:transcriptional regulator with XRE-family HTH domain
MHRQERARIVGDYVRARLTLECQQRGRAAKIAEKTGFAAAHISLIRKGHRTVGTDFARAMAELWGLSYEELERLAFENHGLPYSAPAPVVRDLPNLRATIEWCHEGKVYPARFLRRYEAAAERLAEDRPRRAWLVDLEAAFAAQRTGPLVGPTKAGGRKQIRGVRPEEEPSGVHTKADLGAAVARSRRSRATS